MRNKNIFYTLGVIIFVVFSYRLFFSPPKMFPVGTIVQVEEGSSLRGVSLKLKNEDIIRSRLVFEAFVILFGRERVIEADYYFEDKLPAWSVARRISHGESHIAPIVVTIPEGFNNKEVGETFATKLPNFNKAAFLLNSEGLQGYLFPDTYFFVNTADDEVVLSTIRENFSKKIKTIRPEILASGRGESEIIKMASLVEGEAKGVADRAIISGILWKRIKIGMPLQVDVSPETYKRTGLPKIPVGNPGMAAISAAVHPESSPYLFYLHDKNGIIHYAKTFAEHNRNIEKYLR